MNTFIMDPFTIAMGLSGFLSLAIQVTQILRQYTETFESAPTDAENMLAEVAALVHALNQLKDFLEDNDDAISAKFNFHEQSALIVALKICREAIESLYKSVRKFAGTGKRKNKNRQWWEQLKWPFQKEDCAEIIERLHRCSQTFKFSLTVSNWYVTYPLLSPTLIDEATCSELLAKTSAELRECKTGMEAILKFAPELSSRIDSLSNVVDLIPISTGRLGAKDDLGLMRKTDGKSPR